MLDWKEVVILEKEVAKLDVSIAIESTEDEIHKCLLSNLSSGIFVDGELVCYDLAYYDDYECIAYSEKSYTKEEHRGKGYMRMTIQWLLDNAKERDYVFAICMVSPTNIGSTKVVERCGFVKVAERNNVYGSVNKRDVFVCKLT